MNSKFNSLIISLLCGLLWTTTVQAQWQNVESTDGSLLTARHEAAGVVVGEDIYLIGGRGNRPVERFSTSRRQWENLGLAPLELHHMQPVAIGTRIYVLGAFTCCYPQEKLVAEIHVFDTRTETWDVVGTLPADRLRGSAAAVVHRDRIYLLGGNTRGHDGGAVAWFDEYDPATGNWRELPDAPHARDHFSAVMVGNELVAAAGRQTTLPSPASNPVRATDVYDFDEGRWHTSASIPTGRGGTVTVAYGSEVIVAGGEINTSRAALTSVEVFDVQSGTWRALSSMNTGRHGSGGGIVGRQLYMFSGAVTIGGSTETRSAESLLLAELDMSPPLSDESDDVGSGSDPGDESSDPGESAIPDTTGDTDMAEEQPSDASLVAGDPASPAAQPGTKPNRGGAMESAFLLFLALFLIGRIFRRTVAGETPAVT